MAHAQKERGRNIVNVSVSHSPSPPTGLLRRLLAESTGRHLSTKHPIPWEGADEKAERLGKVRGVDLPLLHLS